jgi:hypothetical protein
MSSRTTGREAVGVECGPGSRSPTGDRGTVLLSAGVVRGDAPPCGCPVRGRRRAAVHGRTGPHPGGTGPGPRAPALAQLPVRRAEPGRPGHGPTQNGDRNPRPATRPGRADRARRRRLPMAAPGRRDQRRPRLLPHLRPTREHPRDGAGMALLVRRRPGIRVDLLDGPPGRQATDWNQARTRTRSPPANCATSCAACSTPGTGNSATRPC